MRLQVGAGDPIKRFNTFEARGSVNQKEEAISRAKVVKSQFPESDKRSLELFWSEREDLANKCSSFPVENLPQAEDMMPACTSSLPSQTIHGFEVMSFYPSRPLRPRPMSYGNLDVNASTSSCVKTSLVPGRPLTHPNKIVQYTQGRLRQLEEMGHRKMKIISSGMRGLLNSVNRRCWGSRPISGRGRSEPYVEIEGRSYFQERLWQKGWSDKLFFPALSLLLYCLCVDAGEYLQLSFPSPKVSEIPKPYDYRIFYIGILACVQLFRRPGIAQRDLAEYDRHIVPSERHKLVLGQK